MCMEAFMVADELEFFFFLLSRQYTVFCTDQAVLDSDLGTVLCGGLDSMLSFPFAFLLFCFPTLEMLATCTSRDVHACVIILLSTTQTCSKHAELLLLNKYRNG